MTETDPLLAIEEATTQLRMVTPTPTDAAAYINAAKHLASVGVTPEQITDMAQLIARGGFDVRSTHD